MTTTIHTATGPKGEVFKRTSKSRTYSHMVAGRLSYDYAVQRAHDNVKQHRAEYQQNLKYAAEGYEPSAWMVGKPHYDQVKHPGKDHAEVFRQDGKDSATRWLADKPATADAYAQQMLEAELATITQRKADGVYDRLTVDFGWSSRLDLAGKVASQHSGSSRYAEVVILETQRTVK